MGKSIRKIVNWKQYNQALVNRGSLIFWVDEAAVKAWYYHEHHGVVAGLAIVMWRLKPR